MKLYSIKSSQFLPVSLDEAWDFFSSPDNLNKITPKSMAFVTTSGPAPKMYPGQIISYTLSPFPLIKVRWVTEITHVIDHQYFVDEQRFGPYKFWHHQHHFEAVPGGVQMNDVVHYAIPMGILGRMFLPLVRMKLKEIFDYRTNVVAELFNKP